MDITVLYTFTRFRFWLSLSFILNSFFIVKLYYGSAYLNDIDSTTNTKIMSADGITNRPSTWSIDKDIAKLVENQKYTRVIQTSYSSYKSMMKWKQCIFSIQNKIMESFSEFFEPGEKQDAILIDPAYHENIGDNLISYGEMLLLEKMSLKYRECGIIQSRGLNDPCFNFKKYERSFVGIWHGGGNWGDLWDMQSKRIASFNHLLSQNMTVVGMPQSLFYNVTLNEITDARKLNAIIGTSQIKNNKVVLSWRQNDSYKKALKLYPMVEHRLVPDIAFMIGPIQLSELNRREEYSVDLLFLLRRDKESVLVPQKATEAINKTIINTFLPTLKPRRNITFKVVDWGDCLVGHNLQKDIHVMQQLKQGNTSFDFNDRFTRAACMFSEGKVVITDRLHGSILAFLCHKPHIYIDQMYRKIELTRKVAFDSSPHCQDKHMLMYDKADNLEEAVKLSVNMLDKYGL